VTLLVQLWRRTARAAREPSPKRTRTSEVALADSNKLHRQDRDAITSGNLSGPGTVQYAHRAADLGLMAAGTQASVAGPHLFSQPRSRLQDVANDGAVKPGRSLPSSVASEAGSIASRSIGGSSHHRAYTTALGSPRHLGGPAGGVILRSAGPLARFARHWRYHKRPRWQLASEIQD